MKHKKHKKKTKKRIVDLTWNQVRSIGGITKKEYKRRVRISQSLQLYHSTSKTKKERIQKTKRKEQRVKEIPERVRKQRVINYRSDMSPYYLSIRVVTINPEINETGLLLAINELKNDLQNQSIYLRAKKHSVMIDFNNLVPERSSIGSESKVIPTSEDRILNDGRIHYEILVENNPPITGVL